LIPEAGAVRVTLHFLDPDVEVSLADELLDADACREAIDRAMMSIVRSSVPASFSPRPAAHCVMCGFREICQAGLDFLGSGGQGRW
jgi:hypothetical protein